jgi:hypothetical protein
LRQYSPWKDFAVSGKHDGLHSVLVVYKGRAYIVYNNSYQAVKVSGASKQLLMIEGEVVGDRFYVYDCMVIDGRDITA